METKQDLINLLKNSLTAKEKEIIDFVEKNFAGLDTRYNTFWGHDTDIGTKDEIVNIVKEFIIKQALEVIENERLNEIKFIEYLERQIISSGERVYTEWLKQELSYRKEQLNSEMKNE